MSLIELVIIVLLALGLLDKSKVSKAIKFLSNDNSSNREIIGDDSIEEKWVWIEEEWSGTKPFFDHFKELNQRIILSIVVLVSAFVLFYINYTDIYNLLTNPLVEAGYTKADLVAFTIYEGFQVKISNTLLVSFIGTFPITFLIIANFVKPAINNLKSSTYVIYLISFLFLFYSGLFAAYQTFPIGIKFLLQFNESEIILRTQNYFQLVSRISLIFGISFQTPLVIYFLIKKNIIKLSLFTNNRKEVFIFVLIFSAILTPTGDPITLFIFTIPLYLLIELVVYLNSRN